MKQRKVPEFNKRQKRQIEDAKFICSLLIGLYILTLIAFLGVTPFSIFVLFFTLVIYFIFYMVIEYKILPNLPDYNDGYFYILVLFGMYIVSLIILLSVLGILRFIL